MQQRDWHLVQPRRLFGFTLQELCVLGTIVDVDELDLIEVGTSRK
jgi:hypothetical protein